MTVKGPALRAVIEDLGFLMLHDKSDVDFVVRTPLLRVVAKFDVTEDGAFRFGTVDGEDCISWFEFHIKLQEFV